jgi:predicted Zn finger-like uncharacterized protein
VQAQCPQCATRIQIPDAKVPEAPFKVRCPKCQALLTLPGRGGAAPPDAAPPSPAEEPQGPPPAPELPPAAAPPPAPAAATPEWRSGAEAEARRERLAAGEHDALVALSTPALQHVRLALEKLHYRVDTVEDIEEGARLLEQGVYEMAVTERGRPEPGKPETLAQRMLRMPIDTRRRVFVVLVGDEFRTGDGTQAWAAQADLVLNPADAPRCENLVRATLAERKRLYQPLVDARRRIESD